MSGRTGVPARQSRSQARGGTGWSMEGGGLGGDERGSHAPEAPGE